MVNKQAYCGNLQSYKFYLRPAIIKKCGSITDENITEHQKMIQRTLQFLALNNLSSTWDIAKKLNSYDLLSPKSREKEYRRLFVGRTSGTRFLPGLLNSGLVTSKEDVYKNRKVTKYGLSIYGILFCMDGLKFSDSQIDQMLTNYKDLIPKIFGRWSDIKNEFGKKAYCLRILSKGILFDFGGLEDQMYTPLYELMNYLNIKYRKNFDYIPDPDLAEQISYWFYSYLLFYVKNDQKHFDFKWFNDHKLQKWFFQFGYDAKEYFFKRVKKLTVFDMN